MKKIKFFKVAGLFILLLTLLLITGCEDQSDQPNPFANTYLVTSSTSKGGTIDPIGNTYIQGGDSLIYKIIPDSAHSIFSIKVDGVELSDVTNTLKIVATKNKTVEVEFIQNQALLLVGDSWHLGALKYLQNGEVVADLILDEEQLAHTIRFYADGSTSGGGHWSLSENGDSLFLENIYNPIVILTKDKLAFDIESNYYNKPAIFRQEYYRP